MIYNYYCVNCGNENKGEDICFDLSELIGVRSDSDGSTADPLAMINSGVLKAHASMSQKTLQHGVITTIRISLKIYLTILGLNNNGRNGIGPQEMRAYDYSELDEALAQVYTSNENREAAAATIANLATSIRNQFEYVGPEDSDSRENTDFYVAKYYVKPIFFENGNSDKLYTIEYAKSLNDPNTIPMRAPEPIRGYCPKCGKPILLNTGIYPHVLVGLLGTQRAGKTTTILALLNEISRNFRNCGIMYNNTVLCDASYRNVQRDKMLFQRGYPPMKTNKDGTNAFNASMLLESADTHQKKIVTFADIAGEKCYNIDTDNVDLDALRSFPLINSCDVYLLCSSIDRTQYGSSNDDNLYLPPNAILNIAMGIYGTLRNPRKVPPLCVVLTKADVTPNGNYQGSAGNPFNQIVPKSMYEYMTQYKNLAMIYDTVGTQDIREPLEWCCTTYDQMRERTYVSMMSCSALGRNATSYEGAMENIRMAPEGPFTPIGITQLLKWVLQTVGLCPTEDPVTGRNYCFPKVPSYIEDYVEEPNGTAYTIAEGGPRCAVIPKVFINPTDADGKRFLAYKNAMNQPRPEPKKGGGGIFGGLFK